MKTRTNDHANAGYTSNQALVVLSLLDTQYLRAMNFKRLECFEMDGVIYKGNYDLAVNGFVKDNPNPNIGDFPGWLRENNYRFTYLHD